MARKRSTANALKQLFSGSALPVYVLDDQRRIVFCNDACCRWVNVIEEELVGQRCDYHSASRSTIAENAASGLCPPPDVFAGTRMTVEVTCRSTTGTLERRMADFIPVRRQSGALAGVLTLVKADPAWDALSQDRPEEPSPSELHQVLRTLRQGIGQYFCMDHLVGESAELQRVRAQVRLATASHVHVVVVGKRGSGSEAVARTIHYGDSPEQVAPLLPLACELFDAELLRSTIAAFLGREHSAWEDAVPSILLLNADLLPADAQQEMLDLSHLRQFDLRIISTVQQPLTDLAVCGKFSHDLALRLSSLVIGLPGLNCRSHDLPLLAQHFLEEANRQGGRQLGGFSPEALDCLASYDWPGDMDEFRSLIQQVAVVSKGPLVTTSDLPASFHQAIQPMSEITRPFEPIELDVLLAEVEGRLIRETLDHAKGNKAQAARWLGMSRARLLRRIQHLGLE